MSSQNSSQLESELGKQPWFRQARQGQEAGSMATGASLATYLAISYSEATFRGHAGPMCSETDISYRG